MLTLYLMRHGQTLENCKGLLQGQTDGHLSAEGLEQARHLRDRLADVKFNVFLSSDLARAMVTARIVNEPHGLTLKPCRLLRERDWGELTGKPASQARSLPHLPATVETEEACCRRAYQFLTSALRHYEGQTVAAMSHGFFARCVRAVATATELRQVPRMDNAECVVLQITDTAQLRLPQTLGPIVSAN